MNYMGTLYLNMTLDGCVSDIQLGPHAILEDKVVSLEHEDIDSEYQWYVVIYFRTKTSLIKHERIPINLSYISSIKLEQGDITLMEFGRKHSLDLKQYLTAEIPNVRILSSGIILQLKDGVVYVNNRPRFNDVSCIYTTSDSFYYKTHIGFLYYDDVQLCYIDNIDRIVASEQGKLWILTFHHVTLYQYGSRVFRKCVAKKDRLVSHHYVTSRGVYVIYKISSKVSWVTFYGLDGGERDIMLYTNTSIYVDELYIAKKLDSMVEIRDHDKIFKGCIKGDVIKSMKVNILPCYNLRMKVIQGLFDIKIIVA